MTRLYVYASALVAVVAAFAMLAASVWIPSWVTYSVTTTKGDRFSRRIGLHRSCSNLDVLECHDFPSDSLCRGEERYFCSMWRTVGFLANLAVCLGLAAGVSFIFVLAGGKYKRETGWPFVSAILAVVAAMQLVIISIVAYLFDHDDQFTIPGWHLDVSWQLSTASGVLFLAAAAGLVASAYLLPPENDYEFLQDSPNA